MRAAGRSRQARGSVCPPGLRAIGYSPHSISRVSASCYEMPYGFDIERV